MSGDKPFIWRTWLHFGNLVGVLSSCESLFTRQVFSRNVTELCGRMVRMYQQEGSRLWSMDGEQVAARGGERVLLGVSWLRGFNCRANMSFVSISLWWSPNYPDTPHFSLQPQSRCWAPFLRTEGLYLESCSHWLWPGLNTTARHCAQSWRMAQLLWQTFNFSTFCSMTHASS